MKIFIATIFLFSRGSSLKIQQASQKCTHPWILYSGNCQVGTANGSDCITSPHYPSQYGNSENCNFSVCERKPFNVRFFSTEAYYDHLEVNGIYYSGTDGATWVALNGTTPNTGSSILWVADGSVTATGWEICPGTTTTTTTTTTTPRCTGQNWRVQPGYESSRCVVDGNGCMTNRALYDGGAANYTNNVNCYFDVCNNPALLDWQSLKLETSDTCSYDYLEIPQIYNNTKYNYKYCGGRSTDSDQIRVYNPSTGTGTYTTKSQLDDSLIRPAPNSVIHFSTDGSVTAAGFKVCAYVAPAGAMGDPHITNVQGAKFDISKQGLADLIKVPSHNAKDLRMEAIFERTISWCCIGIYVTEVRLTGNWLKDDNTITVRSAQKNSLQPSVLFNHKEVWPFQGDLKDSQVMIKALNYSDSAQGILVKLENDVTLEIMRIREKPEFCDDVIPENLQQAYSFLNINVQGLGRSMAKSSVGGLLGTDDYSAWTGNHNCDVQESDRRVSGNVSMTKRSPSDAKLNDFFASRVTVS